MILIILALLAAVALTLGFIIGWVFGKKEGWNEHLEHERNREAERQIRANRSEAAAERARQRGVAPDWYRQEVRRQAERPAPGSAVTAASIGTVFIPGPGRPQPGRLDTGPGTERLPRLEELRLPEPRLTDTGEMAAATDAYIADMTRRAEADRAEILT